MAEVTWQAHSSEILSVVWAGSSLVISASADHSVRLWTTDCQPIACLGQTFTLPASSPQTNPSEGSATR